MHKWGGLFFTFFLIVFALSGIVLNHRAALSEVDVPRAVLPPSYRLQHWNLGAVKGTLRVSSDSLLLYGENGLWLTDSSRTCFTRFERGMRPGADNRLVANVVRTRTGQIFAVTTFDAYQWNQTAQSWERLTERFAPSDRMTDAAVKGDTLVLQNAVPNSFSLQPLTSILSAYICKLLPMLSSGVSPFAHSGCSTAESFSGFGRNILSIF